MNQGATLADELNMTLDFRGRHVLPSQETCEIDSLPDDLGKSAGFIESKRLLEHTMNLPCTHPCYSKSREMF